MPSIRSIGLLGRGFLGRTLEHVFSRLAQKRPVDLKIHDKNPGLSLHSLEEVAQCDVVFIGVPTPMILETGECYTGFVEQAIGDLRAHNTENLIVIKSTVPPGTCYNWHEEFGNIVFNPEFLTEKSPELDFCETDYQILGTSPTREDPVGQQADQDYRKKVIFLKNLFHELKEHGITRCESVILTDFVSAETTKYVRNSYLATRLSFFNEVRQICDRLGVSYEEVAHMVGLDNRIGNHYNTVSLSDPGFGGHCLPKDLSGLIYVAEHVGVKPTVLKAVVEKNLEVRKNKDWENMTGRAVISQKDVEKK